MPIQTASRHVTWVLNVCFFLGTDGLIEQHPLIAEEDAHTSDEQLCRKDTGERFMKLWTFWNLLMFSKLVNT